MGAEIMLQVTPRRFAAAVVLAVSSLIPTAATRAATLYASSYEGQSLWKVDTVALTTTQIWNTVPAGNQPDSLVFDTAGNIIYSAHLPGRIQSVNLGAATDTTISSPTAGFGHPTDLLLDPSGTTVLCGDYIVPALKRVSVTGGPTTTLPATTPGTYYSGLAYAGGVLYANAGTTSGHGGYQVLRLDSTTGATLGASALNLAADLDGLTFVAFSGHLWATDNAAGLLVEFNPTTLTSVSHPLPTIGGFSLLPDGLCGDGAGKLWWASRKDFNIYEYDIASGISTPVVNIFGLDDLAPASGPGSPFPEPASLSLLGLPMIFARRRRD
jgi:streptogramin lyase